jgi:hypothetical protein
MDDLLLFRGNEVVLGRNSSKVECFFVPRQEVKLEITGEKSLSRTQKATITSVATGGSLAMCASFGPDQLRSWRYEASGLEFPEIIKVKSI